MSKILQAYIEQEQSIRRIIAKYRSNIADIDELAHDVFLTGFAIELREEIRKPGHLLLRIAKNLSINETQRKINTTSVSIEDSGDSSVYSDEGQHSPEDVVDGRRKLLVFSEALANLSPELRRAFVMKRVDGLKFNQIATRLNVSKSTVEKRVAKAMALCEDFIRSKGIEPSEVGMASKRGGISGDRRVARIGRTKVHGEKKV